MVESLNNLYNVFGALQTPQYVHLRVAINNVVHHVLSSVEGALPASVFDTEHLGVASIGQLVQLNNSDRI